MEAVTCFQYPKYPQFPAIFYGLDPATKAVEAAGTSSGSSCNTTTTTTTTSSLSSSGAAIGSICAASATVSPLSTNPHAQKTPRDLVDPELQPAVTPPVTRATPIYSRHFVPSAYFMASTAVAEPEQSQSNGLGQTLSDDTERTDTPIKAENSPVSATAPQHRRGYQACDPCRKRKVKCDLGDVDKPQLGKCARCLREKKECVFSPTRRKRKSSLDTSGSEREVKRRHTGGESSSGEVFNSQPSSAGHRYPQSPVHNIPSVSPQLPWSNAQSNQDPASSTHNVNATQTWPTGSHIAPKTVSANGHQIQSTGRAPSLKVKEESSVLNIKAAKMLNRPVSTSHEVLHLLAEAAEKSDKAASKTRPSEKLPPESESKAASHHEQPSKDHSHLHNLNQNQARQGSSHHASQVESPTADEEGSEEMRMALKAWQSTRFVRAGWFTASEAVAYIEYYYEHLAPLTPVVLPDYRRPAAHLTLLTEEPILAVAILLIASRYAKLKGPAHASRPIDIQNVLWSHLRGMVNRLLWGQEQFGGGFCGGGAVKLQEAKTGQITWKGSLRTLGTVEALLLLTEWQPRALHFPPSDHEDKLIHGATSLDYDDEEEEDEQTGQAPAFSHWLEPQWRSDRMSWMLLGMAQSLAFELGVFDRSVEHGPDPNSESDVSRKLRLRRLVLLYMSQTSGRLGITSPLSLSKYAHEFALDAQDENPVDVMQKLWLHIASIMNKANEEIFPSREVTRELTSSGRYATKVDEFWPLLREWKSKYDENRNKIDRTMQYILLMDYDYARLYINSLGVQAMVGQLTRIKSKQSHAVPPATLLDMYLPNQKYIREVYLAGRQILMSTLNGLVPDSHLTHASVRTYSRILSGLIFSLKCLTFGATEPQYLEMLRIVDDTTTNLREMVVDDVHLASHSADLVTRLTKHLRSRFSRFTLNPNGSESASRDRTPAPLQSQYQGVHHSRQTGTMPLESIPEDTLAQPFGYQFDGTQFHNNTDLHDLLGQIPTQPMTELENMTDSYMPPPDYNTYISQMDVPGNSDAAVSTGIIAEENTVPDWLAVPLNNFFNNSSMPVDQGFGGIGPTVGDRDMLELAMNSQYTRWGGGSTSFQGGY